MTREEAIRELREDKALYETDNCHAGDGSPDGDLLEAIDMAIEALSAEAEWIPCSDRLPSESGDYLCTITLYAGATYTEVLTFHKGRFYEDDDEWGTTYHDDVLAWMPLPKPYKGGEDE